MNLAQFIHMDGYAFYVWSAYGLAVIAFGGVMIQASIRLKRLKKRDLKK